MRTSVGVILLFLLFACADLEKSKQLNKINSLKEKIDSLLIVLNQVNNPDFTEEIRKNKVLLSELKTFASKDTLMETEARLVYKYSNYIERLSALKTNWGDFNLVLQKQKKDVKILGQDIENGFGKRNMYNKNLKFEYNKSKDIENKLNVTKDKKSTILANVLTTKTKINALIQKLQSKQN